MGVAELRKLLEDFGQKNQDHYNRLHHPSQGRSTMNVSTVETSKPENQSPPQDSQSQNDIDPAPSDETEESYASEIDCDTNSMESVDLNSGEEDALVPATKHLVAIEEEQVEISMKVPSTPSFDESFGIIKKNQSGGDKTASTAVDSEVLQGQSQSWDFDPPSVASWWSEEDFSEASFEPEDATPDEKKPSLDDDWKDGLPASGGIQGFEQHMGPDHVAIINRNCHPVPSAVVDDICSVEEPAETETSMHNATLFKDKILTASTLDFLCDTQPVANVESPGSDDASVASSYDDEGICWTGSDANLSSSISEEAEGSTLGKMFLNLAVDSGETEESEGGYEEKDTFSTPPKAPRRKLRDPKDLQFLQSETLRLDEISPISHTRPVRSSVQSKILRFGGAGKRKKLVDRMMEKLEKHMAEDNSKSVVHVRKTKFVLCQKTGKYEKRIVLDKQYK